MSHFAFVLSFSYSFIQHEISDVIPFNGYCLEVNQKLSLFEFISFILLTIQRRKSNKLSSRMVAHTAIPNLMVHESYKSHSVLECYLILEF